MRFECGHHKRNLKIGRDGITRCRACEAEYSKKWRDNHPNYLKEYHAMRSEAQFTYKLTAELRKKLPDAVIVKLADRFTVGLPDFFISHLGDVTWFEVKLRTNKEIFRPIQLEMLLRLRRGAYIIWNAETKMGQVFWARDRDVDVTKAEYQHANYNPHLWYDFQDLVQRIVALETEEI